MKLSTEPAKPGLIKKQTGGKAIELEIWEMPLSSFGAFAALIPAPLGIGKVELKNGEEVRGLSVKDTHLKKQKIFQMQEAGGKFC